MDAIDEFLERYSRERDYYARAAAIAREQLETRLFEEGVRAIVSARAKNVARLGDKLRKRAQSTAPTTVEEVRASVVDLAGARVALYFPGDRKRVNSVISEVFKTIEIREFPRPSEPATGTPAWQKRFSGYGATHHRVHLSKERLSEAEHLYSDALIEIQVASVLMHAWSEVEHDLIYKPLSGELSEEEQAILDELNGLVLSGEIALERLQTAGERRLMVSKQPLRSTYDVATMLIEHARAHFAKVLDDTALGRTDLLTDLLVQLKLNTPEALRPFLDALDPDVERRPLSEQVIERVIAGDPQRVGLYGRIHRGGGEATEKDRAVGAFVRRWAVLEQILSAAPQVATQVSRRPASMMELVTVARALLGAEAASALDGLRRRRNEMLHTGSMRDALDIGRDADTVLDVIRDLARSADPHVSTAAQGALKANGLGPGDPPEGESPT